METNEFFILKDLVWHLYARCELETEQVVSIGIQKNPKKTDIPLEIQVIILDPTETSKKRKQVISCTNYHTQRYWYDERDHLFFDGPNLFARIKPLLPRLPIKMLCYEEYYEDVSSKF